MGKTRLGKTVVAVMAAGALALPAAPAAAADSDNCIIHRDPVLCACIAVGQVWVKVTGESWYCAA
jgi:hypothetical protein